jgi:KDO2-lipid IV(A) lauroyltransferase
MKAFFYRMLRVFSRYVSARATAAFFGVFARISWRISPKRRAAVCANLAFVFPEKSLQERTRIGEQAAVNFIRYLVDFMSLDRYSPKQLVAQVTWHGYEHVEALLAQGKSFMVMTAHLGNWEIAGAAMTAKGHRIASLALPHGDLLLNALFDAQRKRYGMDVCPVSNVRHCFRAVKDGKVLALLGDRDFTGNGVDVDCGGFMARIPKGPAALAASLKLPLLPGFLFRDGDRFVGYIDEPMDMTDTASLQEQLERCGRTFVSYIRKYPDQWFMFDPYFFPKNG